MSVTLHLGDCIEVMRGMPDASVDSIVTDPPYELNFMGKSWDNSGIANSVAMWTEALRVLKPGGHLLAFSGSRTYHRMTCAIEDAGFEVRDQIMWVYGSGFPKSRNLDEEWQGWGTALKPAHEPICVARKPLIGTVAANVLAHGTGALNIDGCRVGSEMRFNAAAGNKAGGNSLNMSAVGMPDNAEGKIATGRWPANLIHDGSDEVLAAFPNAKGAQGAVGPQHGPKVSVNVYGNYGPQKLTEPRGDTGSAARFFYCAKTSKADREAGNIHPTVKPTDLMRYLCRLITPPSGIVLDPFMGSGSTGKAAMHEGFQFIGIDMTPEYVDIARARINEALADRDKLMSDVKVTTTQIDLFESATRRSSDGCLA